MALASDSRSWALFSLLSQFRSPKKKSPGADLDHPAEAAALPKGLRASEREDPTCSAQSPTGYAKLVVPNDLAKSVGRRRRSRTTDGRGVTSNPEQLKRSASGQLIVASKALDDAEDLNSVPAGRVPIAVQPKLTDEKIAHRRTRMPGVSSTPVLPGNLPFNGEASANSESSISSFSKPEVQAKRNSGTTISTTSSASTYSAPRDISSAESSINGDGLGDSLSMAPLEPKRQYGSSTSLSGVLAKTSLTELRSGEFFTSLEPSSNTSNPSLGSGLIRHSVEDYGLGMFVTSVSDQKPVVLVRPPQGVNNKRRRSFSSHEVEPSKTPSNDIGKGRPRRTRAMSADYSLKGGNTATVEDDKIFLSVKETSSVSVRGSTESFVESASLPYGQVNQYTIIKTIGEGGYGKVMLCRNCDDGRYYACKVVSKQRMRKKWQAANVGSAGGSKGLRRPPPRSRPGTPGAPPAAPSPGPGPASPIAASASFSPSAPFLSGTWESNPSPAAPSSPAGRTPNDDTAEADAFMTHIRKEVAILKKLSHHPHITPLVEVLDDAKEDSFYLVFELCEYGAVMDLVPGTAVQPFTEERARKYFRDAMLGLEYLHCQRVIHRDIKPANIMLTAEDTAQIGDFGVSYVIPEGKDDTLEFAKTASPPFSPPESCCAAASRSGNLRGEPMDIWSSGVTLYCFVHGRCPFEDDNIIELFRKIAEEPIQFSPTLSEPLLDFLQKILCKDPEKRITIAQMRDHPWVTKGGTDPMVSRDENCRQVVVVTEEDVKKAVRPAMSFISKIFSRFIRTPKSAPPPNPPAGAAAPSRQTASAVAAAASASWSVDALHSKGRELESRQARGRSSNDTLSGPLARDRMVDIDGGDKEDALLRAPQRRGRRKSADQGSSEPVDAANNRSARDQNNSVPGLHNALPHVPVLVVQKSSELRRLRSHRKDSFR